VVSAIRTQAREETREERTREAEMKKLTTIITEFLLSHFWWLLVVGVSIVFGFDVVWWVGVGWFALSASYYFFDRWARKKDYECLPVIDWFVVRSYNSERLESVIVKAKTRREAIEAAHKLGWFVESARRMEKKDDA
jgi:hypothetical protein